MATSVATQPKRPNKVPENAPFVCRLLLCPECGQVVIPSPERLGQNKIVRLNYYHENVPVGCAWKVIDATRYAEGQLLGLRENIPDGIDANGKPKFKDEHDLAKGTSFDLGDFIKLSLNQVQRVSRPESAYTPPPTTLIREDRA